MKYRMPAYYHQFQCIGGQCEDTCCAGWNIAIDEESLREYRNVSGAFGERLRQEIDFDGRTFTLKGRKCAFLNENHLCDIYGELGKNALCRTCRTYPRHTEDYGEVRDVMLSMTCPEAARLILGDESRHVWKFQLKEVERKEREKKLDPDPKLFELIQKLRHNIIAVILDRRLHLNDRIAMVLSFVHDIQRRINLIEETCDIDKYQEIFVELSERYLHPEAAMRFAQKLHPFRNCEKEQWIRVAAWMRVLQGLEPVLNHWERKQGMICTALYHNLSFEAYCELRRCFDYDAEHAEQEWENLFLYFIHTYFSGACYDFNLYGKVKFAVFSYVIVREWCLFRYEKTGKIDRDTIVSAAYRYAREVENSDANLEKLETELEGDMQFFLKHMLTVLVGAAE